MTQKETEQLWKKLFECDPETGVLTWRVGLRKGKRAGTLRNGPWPRRQVRYTSDDKRTKHIWYEHRIIWTLVHGTIPKGYVIDHIDGDGCNNRIENLRCVTPSVNATNTRRRCNNTSGVTGVSWRAEKKRWVAQIYRDQKYLSLGLHQTFKEAVAARKAAEKVLGYISR